MEDLALSQLTASAVTVYIIETLKKSTKLGFIGQNTNVINTLASLLGSIATASALHWTFDKGSGAVVITLNAYSLLHGGWDVFRSFAMNELVYRGAFKESKPVPVVGAPTEAEPGEGKAN